MYVSSGLAQVVKLCLSNSLIDGRFFQTEGETMRCPKCKGRMYAEKYYDFVRVFDAWKCSACGEIIDHTILANRARSRNLFLG